MIGRSIDVVDLNSLNLDFFIKINILNAGKCIYTADINESLEKLIDVLDRYYRENENYFYFRRLDLLS